GFMKSLLTFVLVSTLALPAQAQQPGWLGISIEDGKDQGASVRSVELDSPASKAGLKSGDLVVEYNKTPVVGAVQLTRLIRETPQGRTVDMKIRRDGADQSVQITTGSAPDRIIRMYGTGPVIDLRDRLDSIRNNMPQFEMSMSFTRSGIRVQ